MTHIPYVVRTGDHLAKIAHRFGTKPDLIWSDPSNAKLRTARGDGSILACGDVLYVEVPERKWLPVRVGAVNHFVASVPTVSVAIRIDDDGEACAGVAYRVSCGGMESQGTTDGNGGLQFKAPVFAESATVTLAGRPEPIELLIGHLDPVENPSGVSHRLQNLGYLPCLDEGAHPSDIVEFALRRFQGDHAHGDSGIDALQLLTRIHGC
ncbi:MAG: hypothetical protein FWD17_07410 [Polyangiaceae bacterium]|nr:hypothetical protein [Polyangiaceae bacterium]